MPSIPSQRVSKKKARQDARSWKVTVEFTRGQALRPPPPERRGTADVLKVVSGELERTRATCIGPERTGVLQARSFG